MEELAPIMPAHVRQVMLGSSAKLQVSCLPTRAIFVEQFNLCFCLIFQILVHPTIATVMVLVMDRLERLIVPVPTTIVVLLVTHLLHLRLRLPLPLTRHPSSAIGWLTTNAT
jgi:hypothetical protein